MDPNLFFQMLYGQPAGQAPLVNQIMSGTSLQPAAPSTPVPMAPPSTPSTAEAKPTEKDSPKKKTGLTPEQWKIISGMLQNPAEQNPPSTPSAPVVKGDAGAVKPFDPTQLMFQRGINPLWAAMLGLGK